MEDIELILIGMEEGSLNAFDAMLQLRKMSDELEKAIEIVKKSCLKHFENNSDDGGKTVERDGFVFRKTSSGRYKYDSNPGWVTLSNNLKIIEQKMQLASKTNADFEDVETGDIVPKAEYITSKTSIKIEKK